MERRTTPNPSASSSPTSSRSSSLSSPISVSMSRIHSPPPMSQLHQLVRFLRRYRFLLLIAACSALITLSSWSGAPIAFNTELDPRGFSTSAASSWGFSQTAWSSGSSGETDDAYTQGGGSKFKAVGEDGAFPRPKSRVGTGYGHQGRTPAEEYMLSLGKEFEGQEIVIYEEGVHDEVIGAVAVALNYLGLQSIFDCYFRFMFADVLKSLLPYEPLIENPHEYIHHVETRLKEDSIDHLILSSCWQSLKRWQTLILESHTNVICFYHNGGVDMDRAMHDIVKPLAAEDRISIVVLGEHVRDITQKRVWHWAETESWAPWERVPVEIFHPVFDYPHAAAKPEPATWPSLAVVQGNLDKGRRAYETLFKDLVTEIAAAPSLWGYKPTVSGQPYTPDPEADPFKLLLVGKVTDNSPKLPAELKEVVSIHEGLLYPDYYEFMARSDILLPAFAQGGYVENTASSSVAAAAIARIPILANDRVLDVYDYVRGPAYLRRNVSEGEIAAIGRLRADKTVRRPKESEWEELFEDVHKENADMWTRVLRHGLNKKPKRVQESADPEDEGL